MQGVFQVMAGAATGGAEGFFERLTIALHRSGLQQKLFIRTNPKRATLLRDSGLEVVELPFGGIVDLVTRLSLRREISRSAPSVVLAWMNRAAWSCPSSKGRFACVGRLGGYYKLKYYRSCDHLIGNTRDIVDWVVAQGWAEERVHYLPNFADAVPAMALPRSSLNVPEDAPLLLTMGRLHENKAFDVLIRALPSLPSAYLLLAGDGELEGALRHLAESIGVSDRIRFLGWRDDVAALLATADVFVCPSRHEPLGNVVLEAFAHGVPVVSAASQGPRSLITDGVDGLLVPIDDTPHMAEAIGSLLSDRERAKKLALAGQQNYQTNFSEAAVVDLYRKFFEKVAP